MSSANGTSPDLSGYLIAYAKSHAAGMLGPWFMALIGVTFLMGILSVQATTYFSTFGYESFGLFTLVTSCIILMTGEWAILLSSEWNFLIAHYGDWGLMGTVPWQVWMIIIVAQTTIAVAQLFFAHRCYNLYGQSKVVVSILLLGILASLAFSIMITITEVVQPYDFARGKRFGIASTCLALATDLALTGFTLWKLSKHGDETYSPHTHVALHRLRNLTLEAAVPPSICAFLNLVCYLAIGDRNVAFTFFVIMTPCLYVCSLMFVLNSRVRMRQNFNPGPAGDGGIVSTRIEFSPASAVKRRNPESSGTDSVFTTRTAPEFISSAPTRFGNDRAGDLESRPESRGQDEFSAEIKSGL